MSRGSLVRGKVAWKGHHVMLILSPKDSRGVSVGVVKEILAVEDGYRCAIKSTPQVYAPCEYKHPFRLLISKM